MKTILKNSLIFAILLLNSTCSFSAKESSYKYPTFSPNDFTPEIIDRFVDKVLRIEFGTNFNDLTYEDIENRIINGPISLKYDEATADTLLFFLLCYAAEAQEVVWDEENREMANGIATYSTPKRVVIPKFNVSEIGKQNFLLVRNKLWDAGEGQYSKYGTFASYSLSERLIDLENLLDDKRIEFAEKWKIGEEYIGGQSVISSINYPNDEIKKVFLEDYKLLVDTCQMLVKNEEKFDSIAYTRTKVRFDFLKNLTKKREELGIPYVSKTILAKSPNSTTSKTVTKYQEPKVISIEARVLHNEYQENEALADQKYKGKILSVSGTVGSVKKGYHPQTYKEQYYVTLEISFVDEVRCYFAGNTSEIAQIKSGQNVTIKGTCIGKEVEVCLDNCSLLNN